MVTGHGWHILVLSITALLFLGLTAQGDASRIVSSGEILKKIELGMPVDYDNVVVTGDLGLDKLDLPSWPESTNKVVVTSPIRITNSIILGNVSLNKAILKDAVDFSKTKFGSGVFLRDLSFQDTANFKAAKFEGAAEFSLSQFDKDANFKTVRFNQTAFFTDAQFKQTAVFDNAIFNQNSYFQKVQFWQDAAIRAVTFKRSANFDSAQFKQSANFKDTEFIQDAIFNNAKFDGTANFERAEFNQELNFKNAVIGDAIFDESQISTKAIFDSARISNLSLKRTDYKDLDIRWSSIADLAYDESAYYLLRKNLDSRGYFDDASECEYSYRCEHRRDLWMKGDFDRWSIDFLAWASYGYGLRPVWPLLWSSCFILIGGLFFFLTRSVIKSQECNAQPEAKKPAVPGEQEERKGNVTIWESMLLSATYFTSGASNIISATPSEFVPIGRARYVVVLLRLLGWIFFAIFLSSLTRTI